MLDKLITLVARIRLELPGVTSLKEKRRILKSLLTRLRNDFNLSIAEVGRNDVLRQAELGAAIVANDSAFAHQVMDKVINRIAAGSNAILADYALELY